MAATHQSLDNIVKTEEQMNAEKDDLGYLTPYALEEGIVV